MDIDVTPSGLCIVTGRVGVGFGLLAVITLLIGIVSTISVSARQPQARTCGGVSSPHVPSMGYLGGT